MKSWSLSLSLCRKGASQRPSLRSRAWPIRCRLGAPTLNPIPWLLQWMSMVSLTNHGWRKQRWCTSLSLDRYHPPEDLNAFHNWDGIREGCVKFKATDRDGDDGSSFGHLPKERSPALAPGPQVWEFPSATKRGNDVNVPAATGGHRIYPQRQSPRLDLPPAHLSCDQENGIADLALRSATPWLTLKRT